MSALHTASDIAGNEELHAMLHVVTIAILSALLVAVKKLS